MPHNFSLHTRNIHTWITNTLCLQGMWINDSEGRINLNQFYKRVISGLDVLNSLEKVPVDKKSVPTQPIILKSVTIHSNPIADSM